MSCFGKGVVMYKKLLAGIAVSLLMFTIMVGRQGVAQGAGDQTPAVKMLFDFENGKAAPFEKGKVTTENVPHGKYAMLADKEAVECNLPQDWSGYDLLKIDVFNPSEDPVTLMVMIWDAKTTGYWTWVNFNTLVPPGKSTVTMPTDIYVGEKARPGRNLIKDKITRMVLSPSAYPLIFDDIRLERRDTSAVQFEGLHAFDFGTAKSPVMPGYTAVDAQCAYNGSR